MRVRKSAEAPRTPPSRESRGEEDLAADLLASGMFDDDTPIEIDDDGDPVHKDEVRR